jgi:SAM-dependent MidA family methyltransferase
LWSLLSEQIAQHGPLRFSAFQELALYHPQAGFYSTQGAAGRGGDFMTSPEVGPLFAQVMANALDAWWRQLGHPDPFYVIEGGAGAGTLAAGILAAGPSCAPALHYVTVERSMGLRSEQTGRLPLLPPETVLGLPDRHGVLPAAVKGPVATALTDLPEGPLTGVVLANELLDNMAVDLFERRSRHWYEVRVGLGPKGLVEVLTPIEGEGADEDRKFLEWVLPVPVEGARVPVQREAMRWVGRALSLLDSGRLVVIDYARSTKWMSRHPFEDWMRTYRNHRPGGDPLELPGTQDITCEVAVDQLASVRPPDLDNSQTEFLEHYGLLDMISDARTAWHARAALGDLGALRARGRVQEGRALTDMQGLGRFRVLEWKVPQRRS